MGKTRFVVWYFWSYERVITLIGMGDKRLFSGEVLPVLPMVAPLGHNGFVLILWSRAWFPPFSCSLITGCLLKWKINFKLNRKQFVTTFIRLKIERFKWYTSSRMEWYDQTVYLFIHNLSKYFYIQGVS